MRNNKKILVTLALVISIMLPSFALAETNAGIKPGSIFYFFDITLEKVGMFFIFNSEKKAEKALEYADERLAEAKEVANENKPDEVAKAMADYEKNILFATEKSKDLDDKEKSEKLLNTISENTARHQEILEGVLEKVPDEARGAILKAIEASKRGQEEALKRITELKGEIDQLKQEVAELKAKEEVQNREIEELKKKADPVISTQKSSVTPSDTNNNQSKSQIQNSQPTIVETWEQIEARDFEYANARNWTSLTSTNSLGEKRYYRKEDTQWIQKNSEAEAIQPYVDFTRPAEAPSTKQLRRLMAMCSLSDDLVTICNTPAFIDGYFTNMTFRTLVDDLLIKAEQKLAEQKAQNELAQQRYLLYLQTINQPAISPTTRYETYSLPVYSGGLKLESPKLNTPIKWNIQWTGGGGGFIESSSGTTYFQCITGRCFSL